MARSKTQTTSSSADVSTAPVVEAVAAPAQPNVATASKKTTKTASSSKKTSKSVDSALATSEVTTCPVPEVAATAVPVLDAASEVAAETDGSISLATEFSSFQSKLQQLTTLMSSLKCDFRALERKASRDLRAANKVINKRKRKAVNRNPSGFVKPTLISNELAAFLGKDLGTEMARTEVTREINAYIREHKLQDTTNGRKINADGKLSGLLKLQEGDELTYFNLQKYMSPHFTKNAAPVATA